MKKFKFLLLVGLIALSMGLAGCSGDDGSTGATGATGPAGPGVGIAQVANEQCAFCHGSGGIRDIAVVHPAPLTNNLSFSNFSANTAVLTDVSVSFQVDGPNGPITADPGVDFRGRFTFAKLMPGVAAGDQSFWQSYINRIEVGDVGPVEGAPAVLTQAVQATSESTSATRLSFDALSGLWTYVFAFDFSQINVTDIDGDLADDVVAGTLDFAPTLLNRISGQFDANGVVFADGNVLVQSGLKGNPVFDFVPDGVSIPVAASRDIVATETCNACHRELAIHGGSRFETGYCVTCHNPGSTDANSGNTVDMTQMIHKIHYGENLPSVVAGDNYVIVGYRDTPHDYSTVVWPGFPIGEPMACETCHAQTLALADALNYQTAPTMNSCGSCHDDIDFATGAGHVVGAQLDNSLCAGCHPPTGAGFGQSVVAGHEIFALTTAAQFAASIDSVATSFDAATRQLDIVFSVVDPTNADAPYNILADAPFVQPAGASRLAVLVGWDPQDFQNTGSGSIPAQAISINALTTAVDNLNGTFSVTAAIPAGIGSVRVAVEGHPAVTDPNPTDDPAGIEPTQPTRIPMMNAFANIDTGTVPTARREVVDIAKCNACHGALSLHGNNRTNDLGVCVICHNPNATDIDVRPATVDTAADGVFDNFVAAGVDGKREESIDFKRMIHAIHGGDENEHGIRNAGIVVYGFGRSIHDYSHVRYPTGQNNCDMCHVDGPPALPLPDEVLASTIRTADAALNGDQPAIDAALASPDDDLNITKTAAVCSSCHDGGIIQGHMEFNGANFGITQPAIDSQQ